MIIRKKTFKAAGIAAVTLGVTLQMTGSAQAVPLSASCATIGASAKVNTNRDGADDRVDFVMYFSDDKADGHHARARLVTKDASGTIKRWKWQKDTNGANNGTIKYTSYAINPSGIFFVGVEAAVFEGEKKLNSCTAWGA
ncbi:MULTISPECIES: hypothetical protein [Streptomyces]|uniref:hypothetical protein n=1 Tax=Streptomyces TaxID=1883 RepID=UPI00068A7504|nr:MULTISPECIES: hypothetical protein [Streptomyces]RPK94629.1 hypothetical protein EES46_00440 [Streptomyces sp. ADI98-10]